MANTPDKSALGNLSYEDARELVYKGDVSQRRALATRSDLRPEILYYLTEDDDTSVRQNLATNEATPRQADVILAGDTEEDVRVTLVEKVSRLISHMEPDEQDKVYQATVETLEILARDQVVRVRQIMAETLKDVTDAPASVINQLARDAEIIVAEPVLSCSPVLTDADILDIISSNPIDGALNAITQRPAVSESVSDAIVDADNEEAIALLLGNDSAQIREETLDAVIEKAASVEKWHEPLVKRPKLPFRAALSLARFVAENLMETLQQRADLPAETVSDIKDIVARRIGEGSFDPEWALGDKSNKENELADPDWADKVDEDGPDEEDELWADEGSSKKKKGRPTSPMGIAEDMKENGKLNEQSLSETLDRGDIDLVIAGIAVMSELDMALIERAVDSGSGKSVIAVCWKAKLSAALAVDVQIKIASLAEDKVLPAKGKNYALSDDDLNAEIRALKEG
jgi:hypothetical protein